MAHESFRRLSLQKFQLPFTAELARQVCFVRPPYLQLYDHEFVTTFRIRSPVVEELPYTNKDVGEIGSHYRLLQTDEALENSELFYAEYDSGVFLPKVRVRSLELWSSNLHCERSWRILHAMPIRREKATTYSAIVL